MASNDITVINLDPNQLAERLKNSEVVLVDVREDFEYGAEHIEGSTHIPLGRITREEVDRVIGGKPVVFQCRSGKRSVDAAHKFGKDGEHIFHLAGGINGWKEAGHAVVTPKGAPKIDVMRQVQMTAGSLVLLGVILGAFVSPWFLILSGFVGSGLIFAGMSGWCGMAKLLGSMPWNKVSAASCATPKATAH
jgi:rhodanese-related sulfurtransferase